MTCGRGVRSAPPAERSRQIAITTRARMAIETGSYAPHIDIINDVFSPTAKQLETAMQIVTGYEKVRVEGRSAFVLESGTWVTLHQYRQAQELLAKYSPLAQDS